LVSNNKPNVVTSRQHCKMLVLFLRFLAVWITFTYVHITNQTDRATCCNVANSDALILLTYLLIGASKRISTRPPAARNRPSKVAHMQTCSSFFVVIYIYCVLCIAAY